MAENKSAYEDSTTTIQQQQQQQQKNQSHIKKVLNNINNKFSSSSSSSSPPPKMNTTVTANNNNNSSGTTKINALKHSSGNITNSGQQNRGNLTDNKHHHLHHHHHHHHNHHNNPYVIHKTTTESIRLSTDFINSGNNSSNNLSSSSSSSSNLNNIGTGTGNMTVHQLHLSTAPLAAAAAAAIRKPKASSFQITSVTVGNKLSADNGEDSADDLDESHTDDNSRVTDLENETPSVSEDTFSKEDVFFSSNALGTAPVIPTSSQYGLVIVDPELGGVSGQNLQNVHVSVMDAGINIVGPAGCSKLGDDQKELQHRNERFKVVKIESTEPFKRGRWVCMDYLDHTTLQQRNENTNNNENINHTGDDSNGDTGGGSGGGGGNGGAGGGTSETALTNDSGVNVSENHVDSVGGESSDTPQQISYHNSPGQTMQHPISISTISSNPNSSGAGSSVGPNDIINGISNQIGSIHGQNMTNLPNVIASQQPSMMMPATSGNINVVGTMQQQQIPPVINDIILPPLNTETTNYVPGQSQPQIYINPQQQHTNTVQVHGATLPANMQIQNGVPNLTPTQQQQQSQSSLPQVMSTINVSMPVVVPSSNNNITNVEQAHNVSMSSGQPIIMQQTTQHSQAINQQTVQNQPPPPQQEIFQASAPQSYSGNPITTNLITSGVIQQDIQQIDNQQLNIANQTLQSGIVSPSSIGSMPTNVDTIQHQTNMAGQSLPNVKISDMNVPQSSAPATINEAAVIISNSIQAQQQTHGQSQQQSSAGSEENQQTQPMETDSESASGASAVAIDNKIEQAMDLVKSHLMIAVREEVEVLKEKIAELMDRINQLEVENTILKANVSQETLTQLQLQGSVQTVQTTTATTTNTTSTAPTTTAVTNTTNGLVP